MICFFLLFLPAGTLVTGGTAVGASSFEAGANVPGSSDSLKSALLESDVFAASAASCFFASSLSAIILSEQSLSLM